VIRCVVLAPIDLFFPKLKEFMKRRKACGWLEDQEQQFFYNGITALEKCWTKCISVAGVHVEK